MDLDYVQKLITIVSRSSISELQIERDGVRIRISTQTALGSNSERPAKGPPRVSDEFAEGLGRDGPTSARHLIRAPLTGVFYRSATEGEPPLVSVGDVVDEGQKIGVLEAMKTFNVVESDRAG